MTTDARRIKELLTAAEAPLARPVELFPPPGQPPEAVGGLAEVARYLVRHLGADEGREALQWLTEHPEVRVARPVDLNAVLGAPLAVLCGRRPRPLLSRTVVIPSKWFEELGRQMPHRNHVPPERTG